MAFVQKRTSVRSGLSPTAEPYVPLADRSISAPIPTAPILKSNKSPNPVPPPLRLDNKGPFSLGREPIVDNKGGGGVVVTESLVEEVLTNRSKRIMPWFKALGLKTPAFIKNIERDVNENVIARDDARAKIPLLERKLTFDKLVDEAVNNPTVKKGTTTAQTVAEYANQRVKGRFLENSVSYVNERAVTEPTPAAPTSPAPLITKPIITPRQRATRTQAERKKYLQDFTNYYALEQASKVDESITTTADDGSQLKSVGEEIIMERLRSLLKVSVPAESVEGVLNSIMTKASYNLYEKVLLVAKTAEAVYPPMFEKPSELGMRLISGLVTEATVVNHVDDTIEEMGHLDETPEEREVMRSSTWRFRDFPGNKDAYNKASFLKESERMANALFGGENVDWLGEMISWIFSSNKIKPNKWYRGSVSEVSEKSAYKMHELGRVGKKLYTVSIPAVLTKGYIAKEDYNNVSSKQLSLASKYILKNFSTPRPDVEIRNMVEDLMNVRFSAYKKGYMQEVYDFADDPEEQRRLLSTPTIEPKSSAMKGVYRSRTYTPTIGLGPRESNEELDEILAVPVIPMLLTGADYVKQMTKIRTAHKPHVSRNVTKSRKMSALFADERINLVVVTSMKQMLRKESGSESEVESKYEQIMSALSARNIANTMERARTDEELQTKPWFEALGLKLPKSIETDQELKNIESRLKVKQLDVIGANMGGRDIASKSEHISDFLTYRYGITFANNRAAHVQKFAKMDRDLDEEVLVINDPDKKRSSNIIVDRSRPADSQGRLIARIEGFFNDFVDGYLRNISYTESIKRGHAMRKRKIKTPTYQHGKITRTRYVFDDDVVDEEERAKRSFEKYKIEFLREIARAVDDAVIDIYGQTRKQTIVFPMYKGKLYDHDQFPHIKEIVPYLDQKMDHRIFRSKTDSYAELAITPYNSNPLNTVKMVPKVGPKSPLETFLRLKRSVRT